MDYYSWHLYLMCAMYIFAGVMHFVKPKAYVRIMPRIFKNKKRWVLISGATEILLGLTLLYEPFKDYAIFGIIAMLIVFLWVHFYMLSSKKAGLGIPKWILILRIPLQGLLIWWAFYYLQF
ncbi:hypothetical protein [uncultured Mesonia sp.]|uniref:DoxX family protein n=1 Tax=uncultured Mesonia sp. TaxID=399731 RepID=UPI00374FA653